MCACKIDDDGKPRSLVLVLASNGTKITNKVHQMDI